MRRKRKVSSALTVPCTADKALSLPKVRKVVDFVPVHGPDEISRITRVLAQDLHDLAFFWATVLHSGIVGPRSQADAEIEEARIEELEIGHVVRHPGIRPFSTMGRERPDRDRR